MRIFGWLFVAVLLLVPVNAAAKTKPDKVDAQCIAAYRGAQGAAGELAKLAQGDEKLAVDAAASTLATAADLIQSKPAKTRELCTQDRLQSVGLAQAKWQARTKDLDPDKPNIDAAIKNVDKILH